MFKMNMDARNYRPWILWYIHAGIPLTVKQCAVTLISMTSMCLFVRLLVKELLTRSCFAHTMKIQIKYFPRLTTGFYGHSMLREWPVLNNTLRATKVLKFFSLGVVVGKSLLGTLE